MKLRAVLVDDEAEAIAFMELLLAEFSDVEVVGRANGGDQALALIKGLKPDLVFMDIQMPDLSGLDVMRSLRGAPECEVIFVTAYSDFAAAAFDLEAVDYLIKPVKQDRLRETLRRARRRLQLRASRGLGSDEAGSFQDSIWVPLREGGLRVMVQDIRRIEAARDYALLYTRTHTHIIRATMSDLEQRLNPGDLLRIHRSFFVRPDTVARVEKRGRTIIRVETDDGALLDVGSSFARRVAIALDPDGELAPRSRARKALN